MAKQSTSLDAAFAALADPTRRAILDRLADGPASVGELAEPFDLALPTLLKHVRVLEASGLATTEKTGRTRFCRIAPGGFQAADRWLRRHVAEWESRLDRLEAHVAETDEGGPDDG